MSWSRTRSATGILQGPRESGRSTPMSYKSLCVLANWPLDAGNPILLHFFFFLLIWRQLRWCNCSNFQCPATCGVHVHQTRSVMCIPQNPDETASDTDCNVAERPPSMRSCKLSVCPKGEPPLGRWLSGEWTKVVLKVSKLSLISITFLNLVLSNMWWWLEASNGNLWWLYMWRYGETADVRRV